MTTYRCRFERWYHKIKSSRHAENECFYNMFGDALKLTSKVLCIGKLVKMVVMYGILVALHDYNHALLLKLKFENTCTFERSRKSAPLFCCTN